SSLSLLFSLIRRQPCSPLFPYTTLFRSLYARGAGIEDSSTAGFAEAVAAAKRASVAVLVLGEREDMSGEAASRSMLGLPGVQEHLLEAVAATGTPIVLVLMNGHPLILEWAADHVPAIVETWFLGVEAGNAIADVLFGDEVASVGRPVRELKGFQRVTLKPAESRAVDIRVAVRDLAFYGLDMKGVVEPGAFRVYVGPSSAEGQEARFEVIQ